MARRIRTRRKVKRRAPSVRHSSGAAAQMQSRDSTAAGLQIGGAMDPAEKAADTMAAQVLGGGLASPVSAAPSPGAVHRKCAECEAEDGADKVKRTTTGAGPIAPGKSSVTASASATQAITSMGSGRAMNKTEKSYFEPRFGRDFSQVRIHDGPAADKAARGIDAEAFTHGNDIAFAKGAKTKGVMAHELAHVTQKDTGLRRMKIATANHPTDKEFKKPPRKHHARLKAADKILDRVTKDTACKTYFKDNCKLNGGDLTKAARDAYEKSTIYFLKGNKDDFGQATPRTVAADKQEVAYSASTHKIGRWMLASTFMHELFHTCILGKITDEEKVAELSAEACKLYTPWVEQVDPKSAKRGEIVELSTAFAGPQQDKNHKLFLNGQKITASGWSVDAGSGVGIITFVVPAKAKIGRAEGYVTNHGVKSNKFKLRIKR